jgi:hypothetical protein
MYTHWGVSKGAPLVFWDGIRAIKFRFKHDRPTACQAVETERDERLERKRQT